MIRGRRDKENNFVSIFNMETGYYMRSDDLETREEPFMSSFPELLDIGIMGHCNHGLSGNCKNQCYQRGSELEMPNMTLENFKSIIDQGKGNLFQVALGGRGDPNTHENFEEILEYCVKNKIVPNYTTSGFDLTDEQIDLTKKYCGAVAVSDYQKAYTYEAIERFLEAGIKTNVHFVLGNHTIDRAIDVVRWPSYYGGVNAVIFLLHKPVGSGLKTNTLKIDDPKLKKFFRAVDHHEKGFKIGFDSCTIPAIINLSKNVSRQSIDGCEGSTFSAYITSDMKMLPCSFDQEQKFGVDLNKYSIKKAWNSKEFKNFRNYLRYSCSSCGERVDCKGGCPIVNNITLCNHEEKVFTNESK
jgi:radical SAM protein with 4Fe4S-binding SPASM domain